MTTRTSLGSRIGQAPARTLDAALGVAVTVTISVVITANQGGENDPDAIAYLWAGGLGALMLVRRRHPGLVLGITILGLFAYYAAEYPAVGVAVPVAAALYSAAELGRLTWAAGAAAFVLATSVSFRLAEGQDVSKVVGYELAGHALLMAAAIAFGDSVRSRRQAIEDSRRIVALTTAQERQQAAAEAHLARLAIARDLHDSLGHSTAVISLHADVAREALGRDNSAAAAALTIVKDATAAAMTELRRAVSVLRDPEPRSRTAVTLSDVGDAIAPASISGTRVSTDIHVPAPLPGTVDTAAFRIVEEAITNIVKHSDATSVQVRVTCRNGTLHLAVVDNGTRTEPETGPVHPGHGIAGMRERAAALGGTLTAGYEADGFAVRASLPIEGHP